MAVIQALGYITIIALDPHLGMKFHLKHLFLKIYKFGNATFDALMHDSTDNHSHSYGVIECTIH
jgi:hypothetical protein